MTQLVERELIRQEAAKRNIQVGDPEVDAKLGELKKGMSDAELAEKLKANGLDMAGFRSQVREQLEVERVVQVVTRETAAVPDAEVRKYYDEHTSLYDKKQEVRARHVLVKDEATAKTVQAKLKGGADFAGVAKAYSEDPGSKDSGGDLGYFQRGRMVKEFEEAAFKTPVGQLTPIVKTQFGFHILKVEDKREPRLQPFKEVEAEIRDNMASERRRSAFSAWLEQRKQAAKIEFQPGYKPVPKAVDPGEDGGHEHGPGDGHGH
jgi:foldase protein PrsA